MEQIDLKVLTALIESKEVGSRNRRRASVATVAVARAIELGPDAVQTLKELDKGYTQQKDAAPRELPGDSVIVEVNEGPCASQSPCGGRGQQNGSPPGTAASENLDRAVVA